MYLTESVSAFSRPRLPTVVVDLVRRSAAFDAGIGVEGRSLVDDLRHRDALTEIRLDAIDGLDDGLLLIYRAAHAGDAAGTGAILFRRRAPGASGDDDYSPAVHTLAQVFFDSLHSDFPNPPLLAHVALALRAILPHARHADESPSVRGGLASWQERRAVAFMQERLDQSFPVAAVADACGLSVNHFSRAFRRSLGKPPHRWLLDQRIERSKEMLRRSESSLADIALACGFAEQSHFTRVFARIVGLPPGAWRRAAG